MLLRTYIFSLCTPLSVRFAVHDVAGITVYILITREDSGGMSSWCIPSETSAAVMKLDSICCALKLLKIAQWASSKDLSSLQNKQTKSEFSSFWVFMECYISQATQCVLPTAFDPIFSFKQYLVQWPALYSFLLWYGLGVHQIVPVRLSPLRAWWRLGDLSLWTLAFLIVNHVSLMQSFTLLHFFFFFSLTSRRTVLHPNISTQPDYQTGIPHSFYCISIITLQIHRETAGIIITLEIHILSKNEQPQITPNNAFLST